MAKTPYVPSPELTALLAADRTDLAARLFVAAFIPQVPGMYPHATGGRLAEALGRVGSLKLSSWSWSTYREPDATMSRLILELVLMWERAGIASRGLSHETTEVVALFAGEALLREDDPIAAVKRAIASAA